MPDVLIHHPDSSDVMPTQPLLQQLTLAHHLAGPPGKVDEERIFAVGQYQWTIGEEHTVVLQVNRQIAKRKSQCRSHDGYQYGKYTDRCYNHMTEELNRGNNHERERSR